MIPVGPVAGNPYQLATLEPEKIATVHKRRKRSRWRFLSSYQ